MFVYYMFKWFFPVLLPQGTGFVQKVMRNGDPKDSKENKINGAMDVIDEAFEATVESTRATNAMGGTMDGHNDQAHEGYDEGCNDAAHDGYDEICDYGCDSGSVQVSVDVSDDDAEVIRVWHSG